MTYGPSNEIHCAGWILNTDHTIFWFQYLGDDLEDVSGRTIYDEDGLVTLPLIKLPGMVLVPGETIPLTLFHQHVVAMMKGVNDSDKTFGVVAYRLIFFSDAIFIFRTSFWKKTLKQ